MSFPRRQKKFERQQQAWANSTYLGSLLLPETSSSLPAAEAAILLACDVCAQRQQHNGRHMRSKQAQRLTHQQAHC